MSNKRWNAFGVMYVMFRERKTLWLAEMDERLYWNPNDKAADLIMRRHRGRYFPALAKSSAPVPRATTT